MSSNTVNVRGQGTSKAGICGAKLPAFVVRMIPPVGSAQTADSLQPEVLGRRGTPRLIPITTAQRLTCDTYPDNITTARIFWAA
ncbi:hypothetical protein [Actinoplanes xinjiangensis]|uniref:hypothetical protein n=1 Tax=Actinoplanes xinjiangensis TaxID=512350 RepID=UPI003449FC57